jgi:hypothetical protein
VETARVGLTAANIGGAVATPLFSVVIPTLNVATTLRACLDSVARQTCGDYEVIIVDGGSTDGSSDIANSFAATLGARVSVHRGPHDSVQGVYDAMNLGVGVATGAWVYFLGAEDTLYEADTLARVATFIEEHQPSDVVYGDVVLRSTSSRWGGVFDLDRLLFEACVCHQSIFYRRELFAGVVGPFNHRIWADWDFNIRCFSNPALVTRYMDIVVAHHNDATGISATTRDQEIAQRLPTFDRWSALGMFTRELGRLRHAAPDHPSAASEEDALGVFFVAQSYFDLGDFVNARQWFARRVEMGGGAEEVYVAMWRIAQSMAQLGASWPDVQDAYLRAWEFRPTRAEPLYAIAFRYRTDQRYRLGYQFAELAAEIPFPEQDLLFVHEDLYSWRAIDEQAVCASWIGKHAEAFTLWRRLLARPDLPDPDRQRIAANRDACAPTMIDAASRYPDAALVQRLVAGAHDAEVVVSLVAGPDRAAGEQLLNSFLRCCLDVSRVGRFLVVDAGLSAQDRALLGERYGFLEFTDSRPAAEPDAQLAQIRAQVHGRFWLHLGQGWRFFAPENFITRLTAVLEAEPQVFQVGINFADAVTLTGAGAAEQTVRRAPHTGRYVLTDAVASGPAMFDTARLDRAGGLQATDTNPIAELARRAAAAGLHTASLDEVLCIAAV